MRRMSALGHIGVPDSPLFPFTPDSSAPSLRASTFTTPRSLSGASSLLADTPRLRPSIAAGFHDPPTPGLALDTDDNLVSAADEAPFAANIDVKTLRTLQFIRHAMDDKETVTFDAAFGAVPRRTAAQCFFQLMGTAAMPTLHSSLLLSLTPQVQ